MEWYWPPKVLQASIKKQEDDEPETSTEHQASEEVADLEDDEEDSREEQIINYTARLVELNQHLRSCYHYCVWCGARFDSNEDLAENCPGETREDHD